ncbi:unnamed protein product [Linum tenue]|uniref:Uncharacterized protein n=1 Tax=Linum tenue TaxID=586396 RepID=A0AAV0PYR3_9ROSI|nr:unnamed protein product [Linum tenue]
MWDQQGDRVRLAEAEEEHHSQVRQNWEACDICARGDCSG